MRRVVTRPTTVRGGAGHGFRIVSRGERKRNLHVDVALPGQGVRTAPSVPRPVLMRALVRDDMQMSPTRLLPPGTRWVSEDSRHLLIEQEPAYRTISYLDVDHTLAFPRSVFMVTRAINHASISRALCALEPLEPSTPLMAYPLPNIGSVGDICGSLIYTQGYDHDVPRIVAEVIDQFWGSNFNDDILTCAETRFMQELGAVSYDDPDLESGVGANIEECLSRWEKMTMDQVMDRSRWHPCYTVDELLTMHSSMRKKRDDRATRTGIWRITANVNAGLNLSEIDYKVNPKAEPIV